MTFGELRTSWVAPEKNGTLLNIFCHPTNSASRTLSKHAQNIFGNTTYPANRTSLKKSIFGIRLVRQMEHLREPSKTSAKNQIIRKNLALPEKFSLADTLRARHVFLTHERRNARRAPVPYERLIRQMNHLR